MAACVCVSSSLLVNIIQFPKTKNVCAFLLSASPFCATKKTFFLLLLLLFLYFNYCMDGGCHSCRLVFSSITELINSHEINSEQQSKKKQHVGNYRLWNFFFRPWTQRQQRRNNLSWCCVMASAAAVFVKCAQAFSQSTWARPEQQQQLISLTCVGRSHFKSIKISAANCLCLFRGQSWYRRPNMCRISNCLLLYTTLL